MITRNTTEQQKTPGAMEGWGRGGVMALRLSLSAALPQSGTHRLH